MRKKKHLRDKIDARKVTKRDDFDDGIDNRKHPYPLEKGINCVYNVFF